MEMKGADFTVKNRTDVLVIRLGDEKESFDLRIMVPTKGIYEDLLRAAEIVDRAIAGEDIGDGIEDMYKFICRAMSNNTDARAISPEFLDNMGFDLADAAQFIGDYTQFILMLIDRKN